jgi:hypothetical protein
MLEILKAMTKEEWRLHSTMFGGMMFALFPVMITIFAFAGAVFLPLFEAIIPSGWISLLAHYAFLLFGLSVGGFGMLGREVMNRRFGQASLLAYSSRSLPVSDKRIFLNFFAKDVIYYLMLWIVPFMAGLGLALPFVNMGPALFLLLFLTLSLSFLIGLSAVFFLSTVYAHSARIFAAALVVAGLAGYLAAGHFSIGMLGYLPTYLLLSNPSISMLVLCILLIIIPSAASIAFLKIDFPEKKKLYKNTIGLLSKKLGFSADSHLMAKDLLDMQRSEGGPGKIIFSFLFPVAMIWILLFVFLEFIPVANFLLMFSILLGVISSSIYDWLTEYDIYSSYSFLPVKVSTLIRSKITTYAILNQVPLAILVWTAFWVNDLSHLVASVFLLVSVSAYSLALKIRLTGLQPNILLYNPKTFLAFLLLGVPVLLALIFLSIFSPLLLFASPVLVPLSYLILRNAYSRWDDSDQPGF